MDPNSKFIPIKDLNGDITSMFEVFGSQGEKYYLKALDKQRVSNLGLSDCLDFNQEALTDLSQYAFPEHIHQIKDIMGSETIQGFVVDPYDYKLSRYMTKQKINEKEALEIIDHIVKALYSVMKAGFQPRNVRPDQFVCVGKTWKLESLVLSEDYSNSQGVHSEYIWDPRYQAPECYSRNNFNDEEFNSMIVWNIGSLLLDMLLNTHKLTNADAVDKFKGKQFTFEGAGLNSTIADKYTDKVKKILAKLLHYDSKQRMTITELFQSSDISPAVAKMAKKSGVNVYQPSKIPMGKSKIGSLINASQFRSIEVVEQAMKQTQKEQQKILAASKIGSVMDDDDDFLGDLGAISVKPSKKQFKFRPEDNKQIYIKKQQPQFENRQDIESLLQNKHHPARKALQLYKSYYDQSELLIIALTAIDKVEYSQFKSADQIKEVKLLTKFAVTLASYININTLTQGFNQNRNFLDLDGDLFSSFQNVPEYNAFQRYLNYKRSERVKQIEQLKNQIAMLKNKPMTKGNQKISELLNIDFKKASFSSIKVPYRFIVKFSYDSICDQYNQKKKTEQGTVLARTAMFVTYCLTVDKLYLKNQIPDNFKYYFQWLNKAPNNYVPLSEFKKYIQNAPKQILIQNSRHILKKFYNI